MIREYIDKVLEKAKYEIIKGEEPYYGEVPLLQGVWATGKTLEECRRKLIEVMEGWIMVRIKKTFLYLLWKDTKLKSLRS